MKASEFIKELQELIDQHGDQEVLTSEEIDIYEAGCSFYLHYGVYRNIFAIDNIIVEKEKAKK